MSKLERAAGANSRLTESTAETFTVRRVVLDFLRHVGITKIFGNPGSTELPLFRDFPSDFDYVLGLQEAVVVGMADGYAQASRNAAFVNLHSAAGVGHAMGNIFTAFKNCTPMVITAGQQARSILPFEPFLYSAQAPELPKPYVKWSCEPARAEDVPLAIARAYYVAMQEPRGPALVSIPVDDWGRVCEPVEPRVVSQRTRPDPQILKSVGDALDAAARPVLVVGAAVDRAGGWNDVVALAERHNALVYGAPMSGRCSFPEDHRLFGGFLPAVRERIVDLLGGHDVILSVGAPTFTYHVEGAGPHVPAGACLFQIIEDPGPASWSSVGTAVVGNVVLGLQDLLARPAPKIRPLPPARAARPVVPTPADGEPISAAYLMQTISELRGAEDIIVEEAPSSRSVVQDYLPIKQTEGFYTMCSGGLGHSLPAGVGVAMARPDRKVIGVIGDGSSMYAIQALWTAAQRQLPMTIVVVNNQSYAALQGFAKVFGYESGAQVQGTALPGIDFVALAKGHGCSGARVERAADLTEALRAALRSPVPFVLDVAVQ